MSSPAAITGAILSKAPVLPYRQRGVTLLELMVGLTIGLLVVAVAMGALMVSRGISGTVSDASSIQQQAAYAMRVIGMQARQAGSLYLNLNPSGAPVGEDLYSAVGMELVGDTKNAINGASNLTLTYTRYTEPTFTSATPTSVARNCLGGPADSVALDTQPRIENIFQLNNKGELVCSGNGAAAQPIVQNVANYQVRYLMQNNSNKGQPTLAYVPASSVTDWQQVQGIEVCLVLYGNEPIDMPAGSNYTDCEGSDGKANAVDMSKLTGERARRMHMVFRNLFQLRSQGLM